LDNDAEVVYSEAFSLAAGTHALAFYSSDLVGNTEASKTVSLNVLICDVTAPTLALAPVDGSTLTTTMPQIVAGYSDLERGIDPASVSLTVDSINVTAQTVITASSATYTPAALGQGRTRF